MGVNWAKTTILITGGTGSFGRAFTQYLLRQRRPPVIRIFSRDEFKQYHMQQELVRYRKYVRFLLGDVRDKNRLRRALQGVDVVVHAAALKQVELGEYNPIEPIQTNVMGTVNVVEACLDVGVKKSVLISSDKAVYPVNLYGATKLCAEKVFVQGNVYGGKTKGIFSVVRYGNVLGSRGSVVPLFEQQKSQGVLTITHPDMSRFWITLEQACRFVEKCLSQASGGEVFVPRLPSVKIVDLAQAIAPKAKLTVNGIRPGEKLHEVLITEEESERTVRKQGHFVILPQFPFWSSRYRRRQAGKRRFIYSSKDNRQWLGVRDLKRLLTTKTP